MKSHFIRIAAVFCLILSGCNLSPSNAPPREEGPWAQAHEILARIKAPKFPSRQFKITDYGAVAGADHNSSDAIKKAIDACNKAGGGHVIVPPGIWMTGPVTLKSNVDLHLEEGSTLKFSTNMNDFLPPVLTRFEGVECYNYSPFIYALDQENIGVTGTGTLDGSAGNGVWWVEPVVAHGEVDQQRNPAAPAARGGAATQPLRGGRGGAGGGIPSGRTKLNQWGQDGTPVAQRILGEGSGLRPNFVQPYRCKNVIIDGLHVRNSPMWEIHPVLCTNVIVRNLDIVSHGPNNDGCDPESCTDVLIEGCLFDTGDDCIAIKSGRNNDGRRVNVASSNFIIRNCTMKDGHGGVTIGSEISGSCRNVFVEDCLMDSPNLQRVLRLKSNASRGGIIENVHVRNIKVGQLENEVLQIDFQYGEGANGDFKPIARDIFMEGITVAHTPRVLDIRGLVNSQIDNVRIRNSTFHEVRGADSVVNATDIKLENCVLEPKQQ